MNKSEDFDSFGQGLRATPEGIDLHSHHVRLVVVFNVFVLNDFVPHCGPGYS